MRILLLIIQFPPDVNSTGLLMAQLCAGLQARGHQVSVLTSFPHYEKFRVWDEYRGKLAERGSYNGMDVLRLYVYASGTKQRMTHRLLSYLSFCGMATLAGIFSRKSYDIILCTNGSFFSGIAAFLIGRTKGIPFVYNVQDLYPQTPVMAGQLRSRNAIAVLEKIERFMYRHAARVSVITPSFRDNIVAKGIAPDKISVILCHRFCCSDPAGFRFLASSSEICVESFSTCSTTSNRRDNRISPVFGLISARTSVSLP